VVATAAGGVGVAAYALGWLVIPAGDASPGRVRIRTGRAAVEVALGTGLLLLAALLAFRALGIWFSDALVWPLVLIASGGALIWRQSLGGTSERERGERRAPASGGPRAPGVGGPGPPLRAAALGDAPPAAVAPTRAEVAVAEGRRAAVAISRTGVGIALVIAAGFVFLQATGALGAARDVLLALIAAVVVLGVIFAPWIVRLVRSLTQERAERIRSQERAEVAAHLHDSVLQTLTMIQRRAQDPQAVAGLARSQERELRAWLQGKSRAGTELTLAGALEAAAAEVEDAHGITVEAVVVGDCPLDERTEAVVGAAREALVNAAKFAGDGPISLYAEVNDGRVQAFVKDRGPGFDPESVPPDRHGVRESIVGRMERSGGRAVVHANGAGTEIELVLERGS
jgi:signal transduction histidine kinase